MTRCGKQTKISFTDRIVTKQNMKLKLNKQMNQSKKVTNRFATSSSVDA